MQGDFREQQVPGRIQVCGDHDQDVGVDSSVHGHECQACQHCEYWITGECMGELWCCIRWRGSALNTLRGERTQCLAHRQSTSAQYLPGIKSFVEQLAKAMHKEGHSSAIWSLNTMRHGTESGWEQSASARKMSENIQFMLFTTFSNGKLFLRRGNSDTIGKYNFNTPVLESPEYWGTKERVATVSSEDAAARNEGLERSTCFHSLLRVDFF